MTDPLPRPLHFSSPLDAQHFAQPLEHDRFENNYEKIGNAIGEGTYGTVWKARDLRTKTIVALKKVNLKNEREGFPQTSIREIAVLQRYQCKYIVKLLDVCMSLPGPYNKHKGTVYLVFEFCDNDLSGLLQYRKRALKIEEVKCLMKQLLNALIYIHEKHVCHRDLKLSNILISNSGDLKLADFGLARVMTHKQTNYTNRVITLWYRPPELLLGSKQYDFSVDVWSAGCILGELLNGRALFPFDSENKVFTAICQMLGGLPTNEQPSPQHLYWPAPYDHPTQFPSATQFINDTKQALEQARTLRNNQQYNQNHQNVALQVGTLQTVLGNVKSKYALSLVQTLLSFDHRNRPSANDAYEHAFFSENPKACLPSEIKINTNLQCHELESLKHHRELKQQQNAAKRHRPDR